VLFSMNYKITFPERHSRTAELIYGSTVRQLEEMGIPEESISFDGRNVINASQRAIFYLLQILPMSKTRPEIREI